jgi:hypothetical protein
MHQAESEGHLERAMQELLDNNQIHIQVSGPPSKQRSRLRIGAAPKLGGSTAYRLSPEAFGTAVVPAGLVAPDEVMPLLVPPNPLPVPVPMSVMPPVVPVLPLTPLPPKLEPLEPPLWEIPPVPPPALR